MGIMQKSVQLSLVFLLKLFSVGVSGAALDWPVSLPRVRRASDLTQIGYSLAGQANISLCIITSANPISELDQLPPERCGILQQRVTVNCQKSSNSTLHVYAKFMTIISTSQLIFIISYFYFLIYQTLFTTSILSMGYIQARHT